MNTDQDIRAIITDQINRHVAMSQDHRAWLANDISTRVCEIVANHTEPLREEVADLGMKLAHTRDALGRIVGTTMSHVLDFEHGFTRCRQLAADGLLRASNGGAK